MTRTFNPETVGEIIALRGNLATTYLSLVDVLRAFEANTDTNTTTHRERLRAELDAVDVEPLANPADQRW
ncbi:hypothetical protein [Nocardiopsis sp. FR4]|uniref:hypothetical protein n=1 Tax=Nocardiopsis sp. FR4 TaxID=2605985 RepID=UPI00135C5411|nr:hypothetical protein [Nocardiopsis sp. FR4]